MAKTWLAPKCASKGEEAGQNRAVRQIKKDASSSKVSRRESTEVASWLTRLQARSTTCKYDPLYRCASNLTSKQWRPGKSQDYGLTERNKAVLMAAPGFGGSGGGASPSGST